VCMYLVCVYGVCICVCMCVYVCACVVYVPQCVYLPAPPEYPFGKERFVFVELTQREM